VIRLWQIWSDIAGVVLVAEIVMCSLIRLLRWQEKRRWLRRRLK
jgi:cytochrome c biogenesis protein ResB